MRNIFMEDRKKVTDTSWTYERKNELGYEILRTKVKVNNEKW